MKKYIGIILAGGSGTRLYPITSVYSKQLINIYDKPMIYYPLSTLMLMGIKDILIISDHKTKPLYQKLFRDGKHLGLNIQYEIQDRPNGIAEAFIIGEKFVAQNNVILILGDNLFYGDMDIFRSVVQQHKIATIFGCFVHNPTEYGVVEFDQFDNIISIEEKPKKPKSFYAIPGLYIYDNSVINVAKKIQNSDRGELEITDVNQQYLNNNNLIGVKLGRGVAWLDTGTPQSLLEAGNFISTIEKRQGLKIGCIEEIAYRQDWITKDQLFNLITLLPNNQYREYLNRIYYE